MPPLARRLVAERPGKGVRLIDLEDGRRSSEWEPLRPAGHPFPMKLSAPPGQQEPDVLRFHLY
jgi:hypothetical protein